MNVIGTVALAIFVFGMLIFVHELGHYLFARIFHVTINEFSIGMGPRLISWVSKKTDIRYTIALIPFGGFVAMAGENDGMSEDSADAAVLDDPNSFDKKPAWQRFIITVAGATVNIVVGAIITLIVVSSVRIGGTEVARIYGTEETGYGVSTYDSGLREGDRIVAIGSSSVAIVDELQYEVLRQGYQPVDVTVIRNGETLVLPDVVFPTLEDQGQTVGVMDFAVRERQKNLGVVLEHTFRKCAMTVRQVWEALYDLITGRYTFAAMSGPVGISAVIGEAASYGIITLLNFIALISINLGVMNLLPIPALDGFRALTTFVEMVTRKKLPPKVEAAINGIGLVLLLGLSIVILFKDVFQLFG